MISDPNLGQSEPPPTLTPDQVEEVDYLFRQQHGRGPTVLERRMITGTPALRRVLGRPPMRAELLQYTQGRARVPSPAQQFEVVPDGQQPA